MVTVMAVIVAMVTVYQAEPAAAACPPIVFSTGGAIPGTDPDWQVLPPGSTTSSSATNVSTVSGWVTPVGGTSWISETTGTASSASPGTWRYRFTFTAPANAPVRALSLRYAADNGVAFVLDGVPIGGYAAAHPSDHTPFNQYHTLTTPPLSWVPGVHTLDAFVDNLGGPTGLLVDGVLNICGPECSAAPILVRYAGTDVLVISPAYVHGVGSSSDEVANGTNSIGSVTVSYKGAYASCSTTTSSSTARSGVASVRITDGVNTVDVTAGQAYVHTTATSHSYDCQTAEVVVNGSPLGGCISTGTLPPVVVDDRHDLGTYHQMAIVYVQLGPIDIYIGYAHAQV